MADRKRHPLDQAARQAQERRLEAAFKLTIPIVAGTVVAGIAAGTAPRSAPLAFFEIAAQVMVVLFLAAGLQSRLLTMRHKLPPLFRPTRDAPLAVRVRHYLYILMTNGYLAVTGLTAAVVLIWGEAKALNVLMASRPHGDPRSVLASIFFAMVAIAVAAFLPPPASDETDA